MLGLLNELFWLDVPAPKVNGALVVLGAAADAPNVNGLAAAGVASAELGAPKVKAGVDATAGAEPNPPKPVAGFSSTLFSTLAPKGLEEDAALKPNGLELVLFWPKGDDPEPKVNGEAAGLSAFISIPLLALVGLSSMDISLSVLRGGVIGLCVGALPNQDLLAVSAPFALDDAPKSEGGLDAGVVEGAPNVNAGLFSAG